MKIALPFERQDLSLLRNSVLALIVCGVLSGVAYFSVTLAAQSASRGAANALATFEQVTQSVQQIAQEEATVVRYIGRYREMEEEGVVSEEDRLAFLETFGEIREANDIFPVIIEMGEQAANPLSYDPNDLSPGDPVSLRSTPITFSLSLLHEEDLMRILDSILEGHGLIVPTRCYMQVNDVGNVNFTQLGEHLRSDCTLRMFTFDLNPPVPVNEY